MKKILYLLCLVVLFTTSCKNDPLDITPDGRMTMDDIFNNEIRTEAYLNTVYLSIPTYYVHYHFFAFLAGITDEAQDSDVGNETSSMSNQWLSGALTANNDPTGSTYAALWKGIRYANVFLANIDNANVTKGNNKERFKVEAQILRAYFYLELIKKYGPLPISEQPFDNKFDYVSLKRPTFQEVVDFIVRDCDAAINNPAMPLRIVSVTERGRFTKAVAYAIKSQALLFNASPLWNPNNERTKWEASATASRTALQALTANQNYKLSSDYGAYFLYGTDDPETIYDRPLGCFSGSINSIPSKAGMMKAGSCPSQELVDSYDMQASGEPAILGYQDDEHLMPIINTASGYTEQDPFAGRDPRFYETVWYNGASYDMGSSVIHTMETFAGGKDQILKIPPNRRNTQTGYYLRKFLNPTIEDALAQNSCNWKKFRLAEVYLNFAEAENEINGATKEVYDAVNSIRKRVNMPELPAGLDKEKMRDRIRRERRVEFAFEEHRFWDVRRWKILSKTDKVVTGMEPIKRQDGKFDYKRFVASKRVAWQDKYLLFPIPIQDASIIEDFGKNQNPGW